MRFEWLQLPNHQPPVGTKGDTVRRGLPTGAGVAVRLGTDWHTLDGRALAAVVKLGPEEPQVVREEPQGLWDPNPITVAFTSVTMASHFPDP